MRRLALLCLVLLAAPGWAMAARQPVVVELYTAQGCASCGEANANLIKLAARPDVLALTFSVDYWDYLGWPDTFAKPEFADRQKAYVTRLGLREPYTPQVVIDGHAQAGGLQTDRVEKLIASAERMKPPQIAFVGATQVDVGSGKPPKTGAEVWLIRFDPRQQDVAVKKGDNRGQTVEAMNVVREVIKLGTWKGRPRAYRLPEADEDGLNTAVVIQSPKGGRILAAARMKARGSAKVNHAPT